MKVFYRGPVLWNVILFIVSSLGFLYLQEIFYESGSTLRKSLMVDFLEAHPVTVGFFALSIVSVYFLHKSSRLLVSCVILITTILTVNNLLAEFSKIILVLLFFYIVLFYLVYQFYVMDSKESFYNPGFSENDLFDPMSKKISCELLDNKSKIISSGHLTNWSPQGCYIKLDNGGETDGLNKLRLNFMGHDFIEPALLVSSKASLCGCGIKFEDSPNKDLGWKDFYEIITEMGYLPERLI